MSHCDPSNLRLRYGIASARAFKFALALRNDFLELLNSAFGDLDDAIDAPDSLGQMTSEAIIQDTSACVCLLP